MTVVFSAANNKHYIYIKSGSTCNTLVILVAKRTQRFSPLAAKHLYSGSEYGSTLGFL